MQCFKKSVMSWPKATDYNQIYALVCVEKRTAHKSMISTMSSGPKNCNLVKFPISLAVLSDLDELNHSSSGQEESSKGGKTI